MNVSKMTALTAVLVAALMMGSPAAILGNDGLDPVGVVAAADESRDFIIGVVDMTVATLNPNTATMVSEIMIIYPLYSFLIQWDENAEKVIGDLAKSWWVSPDGLTYEFELVDTAYWVYYDHDLDTIVNTGRKVTSDDVKWSIDKVASTKNSRLNSYWPDFNGVNIIQSTWTNSSTHFAIRITQPFVPYEESLMGNPIFPKYIWEKENFLKFTNLNPVGSGAFCYKTEGLPDAGLARLARNPYWYGEESYGWQVHVDEFVMKRYEEISTLWEAVQLGTTEGRDGVDAMMGVPPPNFEATFGDGAPPCTTMVGFHQANGFVYEFNLNQMTEENRKLWGAAYPAGDNNQLLLDPVVKKAITMCVDRDYLIDRYLLGYGIWTNTLVPYQNVMSHNYGEDGHDCILDPGASPPATPDPFEPEVARQMLWDNGWKYNSLGVVVSPTSDQCPLYGYVDGTLEPLAFEFITPDTVDTYRAMCQDIVKWCGRAGVDLDLHTLTINEMNDRWYAADYDIWLWNWVLTPISEAVSGVIYLYTTDSIPADSDVYLSDPVIDALYYEALGEMDFNKRKELCYDLQDLCYLNRGCQALAFREDLYAFNTGRWENFGDLNTKYMMLPDVWPTWLCMHMNPVGNAAPSIGEVQASPSTGTVCEVGVPVNFVGLNILDDHQSAADLEYRWIWGFGGESEDDSWSGGISASHTFDRDGVYTVTLVAKETAAVGEFDDYLSSYKTVEVTVYDYSNRVPRDLSISRDLEIPTAGEVVTFIGSAIDDDGDILYYSWDFGDGSSGIGKVVEHQFPADDYYTVTLMVDDHRYGAVERPVTYDTLMYVGPNHNPWISVPDFGQVIVNTENLYTVTAGDADPRDELVYTWDWGDGTKSATTVPSATHRYLWRGQYEVTVYADDRTGLAGHNVSGSGDVWVVREENIAPIIVEFDVEPTSAYVGQTLAFSARAADGEGDPLTFTFDFDDDTEEVVEFEGTGPNEPVECEVDKVYSAAADYTVTLYVTDGISTATSTIDLTIEPNAAPVIEDFESEPYWDTGEPLDFYVLAGDTDGDTLTYSWDWGDGTPIQEIVGSGSATHTFAESGTYTVSVLVDDGKGLEDFAEAEVAVNWVPDISPDLFLRYVHEDQEYTYTVHASDGDEDDELEYMWDFGDATPYAFGSTVQHTYAGVGTYLCKVYVWDGFEAHRATHNVTSEADVVVTLSTEDSPPTFAPLENIRAIVGQQIDVMVYALDDGSAALKYTWDWGDLTTEYVADPPESHTYVAEGEYTLTVWIDDTTGLGGHNVSAVALVYIGADMPPFADAGGDRTVEEDVSVEFTGAASTDEFPIPSDGWAWTVNDTVPDTFDTMEFEYTFETPGLFNVTLYVTDSIGQTSWDMIWVTVTDETPPTANAGTDQTVHNGTTVTFAGSGTDNYDTELDFDWVFIYDGASEPMTGESPTFTFEIMGQYTVTLRVEDDAGNYAEDTVLITVADLVDPVADAGDDETIDVGDEHTFDGSGSSDLDSELTYAWTFEYDDGTETLEGVSPSFTFDIEGVYVVTLTVEDEGGNTATDTVTITVLGTGTAPVADAGSDATVAVGSTHTFDGSGSSDDVVNYTWTFEHDGDDIVLYDVSPSFLFDTVGAYVVTLNVTDDDGLWDTDSVTITVEVPNVAPVADAGTDQTVSAGTTVEFDGSGSSDSDGTIASYRWTFTYGGQAQTLSGVSPTFDFETPGEYTVTLTVTDDDGATATDTVVITVEEDGGSFLGTYGLPIGIAIAVLVAIVVAVMLMRAKKGGSKGADVPPPEQG